MAPEFVTLKSNFNLLEKITINTPLSKSDIFIGEEWTNFVKYVPHKNAIIITDDNILKHYGKQFSGFPVLSITPGEKSKCLDVVNELAGILSSRVFKWHAHSNCS